MTRKITGQTIWITGASTGIGLELAKQLAADGNYVITSARNEQALRALHKEYPNAISPIPLDVTNEESLAKAKAHLGEITDVLDLIIVSAGTCEYEDNMRLDIGMYKRVFGANFFGVISTIKLALPFLRKSNKAPSIAVISSLSAVAPFPRAEAYGASKAALEYFLRALEIDMAHEKISIKIIRPGFVDTPLTQKNDFDMPYLISSTQAARIIINGLAKGKVDINFPWQMSLPIRFLSFFPRFWVQRVAGRFKKSEAL